MGTTLLFEENHMVGFLPLQSYLDIKKEVGTGKKCPSDMEDIVRCLVFRDALESLKCTYADLQGVSKITAEIEEIKQGSVEKAEVDDFFAQIDDQDKTSQPFKKKDKPLIVIDAQNVAMRHGKDINFSCKGIQIAV